jgi:hypothetical protein
MIGRLPAIPALSKLAKPAGSGFPQARSAQLFNQNLRVCNLRTHFANVLSTCNRMRSLRRSAIRR